MARYFYSWAPLVVLGVIVMLALPWLALVALPIFALLALALLAALTWAIVYVPYTLARAIGRHWHVRGDPSPSTAILSPAESRDASRA